MHNDRLLNAALAVMGCAALLTTGLLAWRELGPSPTALSPSREPERVEEWRRYLEPGSRIGPATAAVTIIEFSDFQCVYCREHAEHLARLRQAYPADVAIVVRHFPITERHAHAYDAALSAECAREQGRFESYRTVLFRNQQSIGRTRWVDFARDATVRDTVGFKRCVAERRYARRIKQDLQAGQRLGVPATPTSLVNGWKLVGAVDEAKLAAAVEDALRTANARGRGRERAPGTSAAGS